MISHTQWNISHKKRTKYCPLQQHGWTQKISYEDRERQVLYDITYAQSIK